MRILSTEQMQQLEHGHEKFTLIDVLPTDQFDATRIPGAINIPLGDADFAARVARQVKNKNDRVIVYCASESCPASTNAARQLEAAGFTNVFDYKGGAEAWDAEQIVQSQI